MTNEQLLKMMNTDELAEFLEVAAMDDVDYARAFCGDDCPFGGDCLGCWKHWLKQDSRMIPWGWEWQHKEAAINVGDEVMSGADRGVVTSIEDDSYMIILSDGKGFDVAKRKELKKTGRHFEIIKKALEEIGK